MKSTLALIATFLIMTGCGELMPQSKTGKGALIGAGTGAVAGQLIGGDTKATLIGTAIGAAAGAAIGHSQEQPKYYKDKNGNTFYIDENGQTHTVR